MAIAVDNLADAESLTAIEKEEGEEEEEVPIDEVLPVEDNVSEVGTQDSGSRRSRRSRRSKRKSIRNSEINLPNDEDNTDENVRFNIP